MTACHPQVKLYETEHELIKPAVVIGGVVVHVGTSSPAKTLSANEHELIKTAA